MRPKPCQGKTAVATVVSDQSGHRIRQASRGSRRGGWSRSMVARGSFTLSPTILVIQFDKLSASQTRQSRLLPFVRGVQPPSWP